MKRREKLEPHHRTSEKVKIEVSGETTGRSIYMHYHRNRLKWMIRNNYVFFIIVVIVCAIVATIFVLKVYNLDRHRNMEALLDKSWGEMHWGGITDKDVEKLKKVYPNFDWEETIDRQRWLIGNEDDRKRRQMEMARQSRQQQKEKRLHQLEQRKKKALGRK